MKYTPDDIEKIYQNNLKQPIKLPTNNVNQIKANTSSNAVIKNKSGYTADDIERIYQGNKSKTISNLPVKEKVSTPLPVKKADTSINLKNRYGLPSQVLTPQSRYSAPTQDNRNNFEVENINPIENIKSNFTVGKISEEENQAWSKYRNSQSQEDLKAAKDLSEIKSKFIEQNEVGKGNIITKDFAQYVPQMIGQIGSGLGGASENALKGAGVGASATLVAGQMGPQVLAPEEIITVPAGAITGAVFGGKAGYMKGVAEYSYESMAGSAYKQLLDLGVPNDIAIKVSGDQAVVNSLIEAAGAGVDIATLGLGKLFSKGATSAASKAAKDSLVSALKAYGVNIASEGIEEGLQEKVAIESEKKALHQSGIKRNATREEDIQRIIDSVKGGASIAAVTGAGNVVGNLTVNALNNRLSNNNAINQNNVATGQNSGSVDNKIKVEDIINKEQQEDFNNSKARDDKGNLLTLYHGTNEEFDNFDINKNKSGNGAIWFSREKDYAEELAYERGGDKIIEANVDMKNPLTVMMKPNEFSDPVLEKKHIEKAKREGYDGVIFKNDTNNELAYNEFYAVFEPSQIKNINNKNKDNVEKNQINVNSKTERYQKRQENYFIDSIADSLGISKFADKSGLKGKVNELANELKENGSIAPEKLNEIFNTIVDEGIQIDYSFYNQYRDLKSRIRDTKLHVSDQIKSDFDKGDYNNFRRTNLGNLTLTNDKKAMQIDSYYQELSESNPELFPDDIIHPADQLRQIAEVQNSIVKTENNLSLIIDNDVEYRQWARREFDLAVDKLAMEAKQVKKVQDEKAVKTENKEIDKEMVVNTTAENMMQLHDLQKQYQKQYEKVLRNEILTDRDNAFLDLLVKGQIKIEDLPNDVNKGGIVNIYKAKEPLKSIDKSIKDFNKAYKQFLRDEADMLTENSMSWKEKKSGFQYQRETMERNFRDIVPDKKEAADIVNTYFSPVHGNVAKSTTMKNEYRDRIRKLNLSDEAKYEVAFETKKGGGVPNVTKVSERALVQLLGENLINKDMIKNSGANVKKIESAVNEFRQIYDDLFDQFNNVLIENGYPPIDKRANYFPHFQEDAADNLLGKLGRLVGIDVNTKELPTNIAGITHIFKPGKKWVGNFLTRTTDVTVYDAVEGFDRYIEGVSDVIHHTGDIQRLRAFEESIRYNYSSEGIKAEIDKIRENDNMAEIDKRNRIEELYEVDKNKFPYLVTELRSYTDNLAGKKSLDDRTMEHRLGRGMYEISKAMENRVAANMVALNPGSWITNFIPLAQGLAGVKSINMFNGMKDTIKSYGKADGFIDKSTFLINRRGSDPLVMTKVQNISKTLSRPMEIIDNFTAESLVRAKYYNNVNKGMTEVEAMGNADKWTAGVMADRSKGALPTIFNEKNPITKTMTMFQTEVNNQLSYLFKDVPDELKEEGIKAIVLAFTKIFVASWLYNELYEKITGRRAALDPIDIVSTAIGDFRDEDKTTYQAIANTSKNIVEEVPFVGGLIGGGRIPISSAIPNVPTTFKAAIGLATGEMDSKKALSVLGKELSKPLYYGVPFGLPVGGGQLKKAVEGISTVNKGGSFGVDSQGRDTLQFPAEQSPLRYAQAAVFGKYSLPTAKKYVESGFKSLSGTYTEKYKDALNKGFTSDEYLRTYEAQKRAESEKDKDGNTINLSLAKNKKKAIDKANPGMNKQKLEQLYQYFDVSEKVWKEQDKKTEVKKKSSKSSLPTISDGIKFNTKLPTIKDKE